jgi:predicted short-subunit dehydrogenase-like oxidoreductase (DUF2520 family)
MSPARVTVAIVGAGGLARAMATALGRSGRAAVVVGARRPSAAKAIARGIPNARAVRLDDPAIAEASIVLLAVPDGALSSVARELAERRPSWRGTVALHAAGAFGPELLQPLAARGASTGVLHPLAVLGSSGPSVLAGAAARIEGAPAARRAARRLAVLAGLTPLTAAALSSPAGRSAYHAAASLASNDLVALLVAARDLLVAHGVTRGAATRALSTLAAGAIAQVKTSGPAGALTGPVARGDAATLRAQLAALGEADPPAAEAHRALSLRLLAFAQESGRLDPAGATALRTLLARGRRRSPTV